MIEVELESYRVKEKIATHECWYFKVEQSSIQRGLINGNYYAYKDAIDTISNVLKEIRKVAIKEITLQELH